MQIELTKPEGRVATR